VLRFAVHRPAWWLEVSPRCQGRPTPVVDGDGRVDIGVPGKPTAPTTKPRLALTRLRCPMRALHRRIRSTHRNHPTRCLVLQPGHQPAPGAGQYCPVQPGLLPNPPSRLLKGAFGRAGHALDVQRLYRDQVEPGREVGGGLLRPVLTPVHCPGPLPAPSHFPPPATGTRHGPRSTSGTAQPTPDPTPDPAADAHAAPQPSSTQTWHARNAPTTRLLARLRPQPKPRHPDHPSRTTGHDHTSVRSHDPAAGPTGAWDRLLPGLNTGASADWSSGEARTCRESPRPLRTGGG
jgi:hypothetical protein